LLTDEEKNALHKPGAFSEKTSDLYDLQKEKPYGSDPNDKNTRYPSNEDSIGIEFESKNDAETKPKSQKNVKYQDLTEQQIKSGKQLVNLLKEKYPNITNSDIYEHPDISYKMRSEAHGAKEGIAK
jgi:hypothetical protein